MCVKEREREKEEFYSSNLQCSHFLISPWLYYCLCIKNCLKRYLISYYYTHSFPSKSNNCKRVGYFLCQNVQVITFYQGSISSTFVHQATICRRTAFSNFFGIQFHQLLKLKISSLNWRGFHQICSPFAKRRAPKKASHLVGANKCW